MKATHWGLPAALLLTLGLTACQSNTIMPTIGQVSQQALQTTRAYLFALSEGFQIAAVDAADANLIDSVKDSFLSDLEAGREEDYRQNPGFSIHLLAGSEGSYFTSPDFLGNTITSLLATLVIPDVSGAPLIFKGEFRSDRFYFADPSQALQLSADNKAYLLTAEDSTGTYVIQTYKGEIQLEGAESTTETTEPVASSEAEVSTTVTAAQLVESTPAQPLMMAPRATAYGMPHPVYKTGGRAALWPAAPAEGMMVPPARMAKPLFANELRPPNQQQDPFAQEIRVENKQRVNTMPRSWDKNTWVGP